MPCAPYAGPKIGFYAIPPVEANVWVEFEGGDPNYPIWSGEFWETAGDNSVPSEVTGPGKKVWQTDKMFLILDDEAGAFTAKMETENGRCSVRGPDYLYHSFSYFYPPVSTTALPSDISEVSQEESQQAYDDWAAYSQEKEDMLNALLPQIGIQIWPPWMRSLARCGLAITVSRYNCTTQLTPKERIPLA